MILFSYPEYENIAQQLRTVACVQVGRFKVGRYANQELHASIEASVSGEYCVILGTIAPPDECLLSILLLAETLKKEGADKITALLPYLAYTRQDKDKPKESLGTAWVGSLLKSSWHRSGTHCRCAQRTRQTAISYPADFSFHGLVICRCHPEAQPAGRNDCGSR